MIKTNYLTHDANAFHGLEFTFYFQPLHKTSCMLEKSIIFTKLSHYKIHDIFQLFNRE